MTTKEAVTQLHEQAFEAANSCVQCGYCLPVCPTYITMGNETHSPRGRINLVKKAAEGEIDILADLAPAIELCIGCRACEVACPVNVPYGEIYNAALDVIDDEKQRAKGKTGSLQDRLLLKLLPAKKTLRTVGSFTWFYQCTRLNKVVQKTKIADAISGGLGAVERALPKVESPLKRYRFGSVYPAESEKKMSVAFFPGCIMDAVMSKTNRITIELLQKSGCEVIIPKQFTCCGALHAHQGKQDEAREFAKQNMIAVENLDVDYVVQNAGGCGAMLHEYDQLFAGDDDWLDRAKNFTKKSKDITQVLIELGPLPFVKEWRGTVTYQDSCHLRNVQGVVDEPRELLRSVPGLKYIEMKNSHLCCGSGGNYNLQHFDEAMDILDEKMIHAKDTEAAVIATTNPGCLLQMQIGVDRSEPEYRNVTKVLHIVEIVAEACGIE